MDVWTAPTEMMSWKILEMDRTPPWRLILCVPRTYVGCIPDFLIQSYRDFLLALQKNLRFVRKRELQQILEGPYQACKNLM